MDSRELNPRMFLGCLLSIKTKPLVNGTSKTIIGTLTSIDIANKSISLKEVMCNGDLYDQDYILHTDSIEDLVICNTPEGGVIKNNKNLDHPKPENDTMSNFYTSTPIKKPLRISNNDVNKSKNLIQIGSSEKKDETSTNSPFLNKKAKSSNTTSNFFNHSDSNFKDMSTNSNFQTTTLNSSSSVRNNVNSSAPSAFAATDKGKGVNPFYALNPSLGGALGNGPPPSKASASSLARHGNVTNSPDGRIVYEASKLEAQYFQKVPESSNVMNSIMASLKTGQQQQQGRDSYDNNGTLAQNQSHSSVSILNSTESSGSHIFNSFFSSNKSTQDQNEDPEHRNKNEKSKSLSKLLALKLDVKESTISAMTLARLPYEENLVAKKHEAGAQPNVLPINKTGTRGAAEKKGNGHIGASTFEMSIDEIRKSEAFDFQQNLAMFEKLPVSLSQGKKAAPKKILEKSTDPKFCSTDTTYLTERKVESISYNNASSSQKIYLTDTNVAVPTVSLTLRDTIINVANSYGLSNSRMIEVMGRAVAQICIPMLGDACRLSPERDIDRPLVLVVVGPHWNGASGVCAARILATLGIKTFVYFTNYENHALKTEIELYQLSGQPASNYFHELGSDLKFDLVISGLPDSTDDNLQLEPFMKWIKGSSVVLINPPLLPTSYRKSLALSSGKGKDLGTKVSIVTHTLPLAYPTDTSVKLFLVNMGIPSGVFNSCDFSYKSPFGDKLILQLFSTKLDIATMVTKP